MDFTIYASGSKGNCYEIDDGRTRILLECGLSPKKLQAAIGRPGDFSGVLITHEHMDHARSAAYCVTAGMPVYMTEGTFNALDDVPNMPNLHGIRASEPFPVGSFDVLPLHAFHDAAEPVSFVIHSRADDTALLFATDTGFMRHPAAGMDIIALECNHSEQFLCEDTKMPPKTIERIRRTHMSVDRVERYLSCCDLSKTREIILLHLSDRHAHAKDFARRIQNRFGIYTRFQ